MSSPVPLPTLPSLSQLPPGSIAAVLQALPPNSLPTPAFRDAACATLRLSRARGSIECEALGVSFEAEVEDARRTLILDLLASAGTPEAQAVMRQILRRPSVRRSGAGYSTWIQRLGFIERPDAATLAFLLDAYAVAKGGDPETFAALAYALGNAIGRAHVWGLAAEATEAVAVLRRDAVGATTPAARIALVTALGNAGLESEVATILGFVDDAKVRIAAVLALRKLHTPRAKSWLLGAVGRSDIRLAEAALSALFEQSLTSEELVRLAELVLGGCTASALDARILRFLLRQRLTSTRGDRIVEEAVELLLHRSEEPAPRALPTPRPQLGDESGEYTRHARRPLSPSVPPTRRSATESLRATLPPPPAPAPTASQVRPRSSPPPASEPTVNTALAIRPLAVI